MTITSSTDKFSVLYSQPGLERIVYGYLPTKECVRCSRVSNVWNEHIQAYWLFLLRNESDKTSAKTQENCRQNKRVKPDDAIPGTWKSWKQALILKKHTDAPHWLIEDLTAGLAKSYFTRIKGFQGTQLVKECMDSVASLKINAASFPGDTPLAKTLQAAIVENPIDWAKAKPAVYELALKREAVAAAIAWLSEPERKLAHFVLFRNVCFHAEFSAEEKPFQEFWNRYPDRQKMFLRELETFVSDNYHHLQKAHDQFIGLFVDQPPKPISQIVNCNGDSNVGKAALRALEKTYQKVYDQFRLNRAYKIKGILDAHKASSLPLPAPTPDS